MTELRTHHVSRVTVPWAYRRDRAVGPAGLAGESHARYDFDTLFYQATRVGSDVVLVAPKLLNFRDLFKECTLSVDGQPISRIKIHSFYRHAVIWLRGAAMGEGLTVQFPDGSVSETPIVRADTEFLAGLNVQMTISKNNDLRWIREQLSFHAAQCGVEGVGFIDNGSTDYTLDDLKEVLTNVGLKRAVLISMPFPWGGLNKKPVHGELYLQTAAYNLMRFQYLARARAVLRFDSDEILMPKPPGETVFDKARTARLGFVRFVGQNRFPGPHNTPPFQFRDHGWAKPGLEIAGNNWCLNPQGPLGRFQWRCHDLEHNIFGRAQMLKGDYFYHCLGISTGWNDPARTRPTGNLRHDPLAESFWQDKFADAAKSAADSNTK